ncbi:MAG TPA: DUF6496 domain-containing protein [Stellaceae bacterium]|nr:DUF6496 domain-containing protein [Stellaceae bacterium]
MAPRTKRGKKAKVTKVMREYKSGKLKSGKGRHGKVKSRKQAIAIAMSESGQSRKRRKKR